MAGSLFEHGAIRTTTVKAKELRPFVERLITIARENTLAGRRRVIAMLQDRFMAGEDGELQEKTLIQKLFTEIAPRYVNRPGGYTRIIRLSDRRIGDGGEQVLMQLVEESAPPAAAGTPSTGSRRRRRAVQRQQAAKDQAPAEVQAAQPSDAAAEEAKPQEPTEETKQ